MTRKSGAAKAKPSTWSECSAKARVNVIRELRSLVEMYRNDTWEDAPEFGRTFRLAIKALKQAKKERP